MDTRRIAKGVGLVASELGGTGWHHPPNNDNYLMNAAINFWSCIGVSNAPTYATNPPPKITLSPGSVRAHDGNAGATFTAETEPTDFTRLLTWSATGGTNRYIPEGCKAR